MTARKKKRGPAAGPVTNKVRRQAASGSRPYDPDFEKTMKIARKAMKTYRNALAALAK